ncbi:hypothetical protein ACX3VG_16340, partial [Escherichia coli]
VESRGLGDVYKRQAPFYERRWGGFLRDFKQHRII